MKIFMQRQFFLFLLTGGTSALVNILSRIIYSLWLPLTVSIVVAYLTGMLTAFLLAKKYVFKDSDSSDTHRLLKFSLINILAIIQTLVISLWLGRSVLIGVTEYNIEIAHIIGVLCPVFTSYIGHKYWSFK